ncbi:peptidoglycan DD-metalloendopeptidase family protein [Wenzhouxiangella sp. XN201]|uniref:peptidoglycan DD-metalloendopeptidase family protein n=1 Tax=Wenzhouxiangella sp. XN201 TaxID=2710755 RepID=UPI0013C567E9|nr:peptidoglycan DD-metalloendopeptidase family protein [Wenzhouxiangella sp. XN201]
MIASPAPRISLAVLLLSIGLMAETTAQQDREAVEAQLETVRAEIAEIQQRIDRDLDQRDELQDDLAQAERAVGQSRRARIETNRELKRVRADIDRLEQRRGRLEEEAGRHATDLAQQLAAAYRLGGQSRLKMLLNQDDPRRFSRRLAYHGYLSRERIRAIDELNGTLDRLAETRRALQEEASTLETLRAASEVETRRLEAALGQREQALAALDERLAGQRDRLGQLERDAAELSDLLDRLGQMLADVPPDVAVPPFAELRGRLPMPVDGPVRAAFGDRRSGDLEWSGWLIGIDSGQEVHSIAHGRVAYADWLRGYGLLLILEHGDGFMSLYAHNEALMRDVGDWVAPGETIAVSGRSGGIAEPALYFELRREGEPIDPAQWIDR